MNTREIPKRQTKTYYPLNSVTLTLDHVNGVISSSENEIMD